MKKLIVFIFFLGTSVTSFTQITSKGYINIGYTHAAGEYGENARTISDIKKRYGGMFGGVTVDLGGTIYPKTFLNDIVLPHWFSIGFDISGNFSFVQGRKNRFTVTKPLHSYNSSSFMYEYVGYEEFDSISGRSFYAGGKIGPVFGFRLSKSILMEMYFKLNPTALWMRTPFQNPSPIYVDSYYGYFDGYYYQGYSEENFSYHYYALGDFVMRYIVGINFRIKGISLGCDYSFGKVGGLFSSLYPQVSTSRIDARFGIYF